MEKILVLTEHLWALVHHFLWPIQLCPFSHGIVAPALLLSANLCFKLHPFQSTLTTPNHTQFSKLIPIFSVLSSQQGQAGKRRENLFQERMFKEHSNRLSTHAHGWTQWRDLKPPWGEMHAKNTGLGKVIFLTQDWTLFLFLLNSFTQLFVFSQLLQVSKQPFYVHFFHTGMVTKAK